MDVRRKSGPLLSALLHLLSGLRDVLEIDTRVSLLLKSVSVLLPTTQD